MARYSKRAIHQLLQLGFVVGVIAMRMMGGSVGSAAYLALGAYALFGRAQVVHALVLCWLFTFVNPGLADGATAGALLRYVVFGFALLSTAISNYTSLITLRFRPITLWCFLLGVFMASHALLFSGMREVSILKAISFTSVSITLFSSWSSLQGEERVRLENQVFGGLLAVVVVSTPLLLSTPIGFRVNGRGFQGVLSHPQSFGPLTAFVAAWIIGRIVSSRRPPLWLLLSLVLCVVLGAASQARVAAVSLVLGVSIALVAFRRDQPLSKLLPAIRSVRMQLLAVSAISVAMLAAPLIYEHTTTFVAKGGSGGALESADESRGGLVRTMMPNIERYFWTGIGFGVPSQNDLSEVERDPIYGLPVSAVVEKGVLPVAILEELGPIGALLVVAFFTTLVRRARDHVDTLCILLTCLASNLAEATFFAAGGMGIIILTLSAWATTRNDMLRRSAVLTVPVVRTPRSASTLSSADTKTQAV